MPARMPVGVNFKVISLTSKFISAPICLGTIADKHSVYVVIGQSKN